MSSDTILNTRYRLDAQQGSGGMAVIYRATDMRLGRRVAVKVLRPSLTTNSELIARFRNEARSIANLQHPNIVSVYDVGEQTDAQRNTTTHYMVMEFVEGTDLKRIIKDNGALPVNRMLALAIQICAGIGYANRAGIVHADMKPQNVLVTRDDTVKVTDFGIAQVFTDQQPDQKQAVVWGSPHYFSPEQARGEKPTPASDVYSIGIVMFEMLAGRYPYEGANQQELALAHIRARIPMVTEFNPNVPTGLAQIIFKTMSKDPGQRYRQADQLGNILTSYRDRELNGRPATVSAYAPPNSAPVQSVQPIPPPVWSAPQQPVAQGTPPPVAYPPPQTAVTQRYDLAPRAPGQAVPVQPPVPVPYGAMPAPPPPRNQSSMMQPSQPSMPGYGARNMPATHDSPFDLVTIALAVLAFLSVACLVPLYIAVLQARLGG
ncbi:MAG: protein kinase [Anaerolineae bacterium]